MEATAGNDGNGAGCGQICPIVHAISIIGKKWKIPILWHIAEHDTLHYNELKRLAHPISNTALTRCLRELEESGLVSRLNHNTIPPSVEYSLTEQGKALLPTLQELYRWGESLLQ